MMVAVRLYAYYQGTRSSRRIAPTLEENVGFRVVAANQQPDFRTVCRFRAEHAKRLERLFVQVLQMCREAGYNARELSKIRNLVVENIDVVRRRWDEYFGR